MKTRTIYDKNGGGMLEEILEAPTMTFGIFPDQGGKRRMMGTSYTYFRGKKVPKFHVPIDNPCAEIMLPGSGRCNLGRKQRRSVGRDSRAFYKALAELEHARTSSQRKVLYQSSIVRGGLVFGVS